MLFRSSTESPAAVVRVGALPDMVTFTPNGRYVLSANEGEPSDDYSVDPEGSISVIDVGQGPEHAIALTADFLRFNEQRASLERQGVRISAPNANAPDGRATLAEDLEPEYIAIAPDGQTAWVTLQENNALAIVDIPRARVECIVPLGLKDHSCTGNGFDASDRDGDDGGAGIHIRRWPVFGMYQPDSIAAFNVAGATYLVTANEGDTRDYTGFSDIARVSELKLDNSIDESLKQDENLGRLKVSRVGGDTDGDGDVDRLLVFGGRSMAIWNAAARSSTTAATRSNNLSPSTFRSASTSTKTVKTKSTPAARTKVPNPKASRSAASAMRPTPLSVWSGPAPSRCST